MGVEAALRGRSFAIALALAVDQAAGEPPAAVHPVARFGSAMQWVEGRVWADSKAAGALYAGIGVAAGIGAGGLLRRWPGDAVSTGVASYLAIAHQSLGRSAGSVGAALRAGDLDSARSLLPALVGRDPSALDAEGMCRATIESVAENTVDAVIAPIFWAMVGGAPGVLVHRAVNTLDAMVGYRSERYERFGWASARLDDAMNYVPARWTVLLVRSVARSEGTAIVRAVRDQARAHPSPNGGITEAAFAGALGLRLGGRTVYPDRVEERPVLGTGRAPEPDDIDRAVRLSGTVARAALAQCVMLARAARRWRRGG